MAFFTTIAKLFFLKNAYKAQSSISCPIDMHAFFNYTTGERGFRPASEMKAWEVCGF